MRMAIKKIILVTKFRDIFDENQIMSYTAISLRTYLNDLGYSFEIADKQNLNDVFQIWFSDIEAAFPQYQLPVYKRPFKKKYLSRRNFFTEAIEQNMRAKCVLFLYEPWVVRPENRNHDLLAQ